MRAGTGDKGNESARGSRGGCAGDKKRGFTSV